MTQQHTDQFLLNTKLAIPTTRPGIVVRPRLLQTLQTGMEPLLTLLAAPAGFGKTMLLSAWIQHNEQPVGWVSLDAGDNDPAQFWAYFITALDKLQPGIGTTPLSLLQSSSSASIETVLGGLVNALSTMSRDITLVLDDYHVIETHAIHNALTFLLDHLPRQLHLIIASRIDPPLPLSRLRVRGQLTEIRADDLRFTLEEATTFFNDQMGLNLTTRDVATLEGRTEGWIAGLQLAALSMQGRKDISHFISVFAGSNRYIVDYLTDEVLRQQSEHIRTFLLRTSILDRLSGSLCDTVTEQTDSQAMLEQLEQSNLFLIPLDDERQWYRYHHLFADTLRYRLRLTEAALLPELHQRASVWFESNGFPVEAVNHALAAKDFTRAATLIEQNIYPMFNRGTHATVRHWLQALPEEVLFTRPSLCLLYAWAFLYVGEIAACKRPLDVAARVWRAEGNRARLGEVYTFQSSVALVQGDAVRAIDYARQALALLPEENRLDRCNCVLYLGGSASMTGNVKEATRLLSEARVMCQATHLYSMLYTMNFLAGVEIVQGKLHQAAETSWEVFNTLSGRSSIHSSTAQSRLGCLYREWNELALAAQHMQQAITLGEQAGQEIYMAPIYLASAQVLWVRGEEGESFAVLNKAEQVALRLEHRSNVAQVRAFRAMLNLAQGNVAAAEQWSEAAAIAVNGELVYEREQEYLVLARLRIAQNRAKEAIVLLERVLQGDEAAQRIGNVIQILALTALAHQASGDVESALKVLKRALLLAEPEDYTRVFVDEGAPMAKLLASLVALSPQYYAASGMATSLAYVRKLLAALTQSELEQTKEQVVAETTGQSSANALLIEPLSGRELEVLALLAVGLSNEEIANRLIVTVGTVKTHIRNIYGKLSVNSRTKALARARELKLL